jgi:1,4-alpha-glucan branching enzyme
MPGHDGVRRWVADLNRAYRDEPALHQLDFSSDGFQWIDCSDALHSVIAFLRRPRGGTPALLVACNFTPVPRTNYTLGVPAAGRWQEILNSDAKVYGGGGWGNLGGVDAMPLASHGQPWSLSLTLPALSTVVLKEVP